jgi:hypothetical protein
LLDFELLSENVNDGDVGAPVPEHLLENVSQTPTLGDHISLAARRRESASRTPAETPPRAASDTTTSSNV